MAGHAAPLLVFVETSLNDIAALTVLDVITDSVSSAGFPALALYLLVRRIRDDGTDATAQVPADRSRGVRRVSGPGGCGIGPGRDEVVDLRA